VSRISSQGVGEKAASVIYLIRRKEKESSGGNSVLVKYPTSRKNLGRWEISENSRKTNKKK